ncbi:MAG: hypothetical protein SGI87_06690 [Flavobacteriales bacterium]|nr:hypothetical protein [Flavobacteriales bacterium]
MKYYLALNLRLLTLFFLSLLCVYSSAQNIALSPYSRFGLGSLEPIGATNHLGMGGLTIPYLDPYTINFGNPAVNAFLKETTFQFSAKTSFLTLNNSAGSSKQNATLINDLSFAFKPETKKWTFVLGVAPYTYTGYSLETADTTGDLEVKYNYEGQGGINKANFGYSRFFSLFKGSEKDSTRYNAHSLAIGAHMNYYFGSVTQIRKIIFDDITFANARYSNETRISQVSGEFGIHYMMPLNIELQNKKIYRASHITAGATYTMGGDFGARYSELGQSYYLFSTSEVPIDTSYYLSERKGKIHIPQKIGFGLGYQAIWKYDRSLFIGIDYKIQDWSTYKWAIEGTETQSNFKEATNLSIGMQYQPSSKNSEERVFARSTYRLGLRQTSSFLDFDGTAIDQEAISAGISIPLKASLSYSQIHLSVEYGSAGTTDKSLIKEDFVNFQIGFSLTPHIFNKWFLQRKYD